MSASFLVIGNSFPSSSQQNNGSNSWTDCGSCACLNLTYDAQTCCLIILPTAAAATFFVWLFFQKGHLAVGLVLAQLLGIVLLGILAFLLATALRRGWRRLKTLFQPKGQKNSTNLIGEECSGGGEMPQQVRV